MASTVTEVSNNINVNFPVPGVDNDTQGFRNNFANIQQGFSRTANEITNLQLYSVRLDDTNDFGNNILKKASLQASSHVVNDGGLVSPGTISVDYSLGNYQQYEVNSGSYTFSIINWPPNCGTIRLEITPTSTSTSTVSFGGPVKFLDTALTTSTIVYNQTSTFVWELFSPDSGDTKIFAYQLK